MILYFSGTGNSEYVAEKLAGETGDEILNLFQRIRGGDFSELYSEAPWVLVVPTYAWRIPRIVEEWLKKTELSGNMELYVVMTCGSENGNAGAYAERLCKRIQMNFMGCMQIVMPENYIAMFDAPDKKEALDIIKRAEPDIRRAADCVKHGRKFPVPKVSAADRIKSGVVNEIFYPMFVHAGKFKASDACISCGRCVSVCPLGNVRLEGGRPVWGRSCTHCMACICRCPTEAIEYGRNSIGKVRYVCVGRRN